MTDASRPPASPCPLLRRIRRRPPRPWSRRRRAAIVRPPARPQADASIVRVAARLARAAARQPRARRVLRRRAVGLADLVALIRVAARNVARLDGCGAAWPGCASRSSAAAPRPRATRRGARRQRHRRPLRPRQRPVRADARPDDDVLVRGLRATADMTLEEALDAKLERICAQARARPRRPRAGDRHRLGRLRGPRRARRAAAASRRRRSPREQHDYAVERRAQRRARGPRHGAARGLPRPRGHATTSSSRSR